MTSRTNGFNAKIAIIPCNNRRIDEMVGTRANKVDAIILVKDWIKSRSFIISGVIKRRSVKKYISSSHLIFSKTAETTK